MHHISKMAGAPARIRTALALGLPNLARVFAYRLGVSTGFNPVRHLRAVVPPAPFFREVPVAAGGLTPSQQWRREASYFGWWPRPLDDSPPDWFLNPLSGVRLAAPEREWWRIPDFDPGVGDIKTLWEASRFDWTLAFAQRARAGDNDSLKRLNAWLEDWCAHNPPYRGPNWKCGQEASIRVMHLAMAALILGQTRDPEKGLVGLVRIHLQRIAPTVSYAMAQDNNHGTSEAAALFIGGSWLARLGIAEGERWQRLGCKWLENRAARLIGADGSFSQYSVNYHRVMLDTFGMVELWRRHLGLPAFSTRFRARAAAAAQWLAAMVDPRTGDAPNLGANDGARLLPLTDTDYRDFRPSVQLAMVLFTGCRAYARDGTWNDPFSWLGAALPDASAEAKASRQFDDGGYAVLRRGDVMALLRYPRFRFRPGHADALHVDLWKEGENLLRDAGTYSYNTEPEWLNYFAGTASHNTVQFDDRDQMPRLGRFLFGNWLETLSLQPLNETGETATFGAGYRDGSGAIHTRDLTLTDECLRVRDEVHGFARKAVLRWRMRPGEWRVEGNALADGRHRLKVESGVPIVRFSLVQGWESRYYQQKTGVPVLEVEVHQPGVLTTEYRWSA